MPVGRIVLEPDTSAAYKGPGGVASRQEAPSASAGKTPATPIRFARPSKSRPVYPSLALRAF